MNPSAGSEATLLLEAPYESKFWKGLAAGIALSVSESLLIFVATHDRSAPLAIRGILWCIVVALVFPLVTFWAMFVVTSLVYRTLKLTTAEISVPTGFSPRNTVVPLRDIKRVSVRLTGDRRSLDIFHSVGRLGIAESWLPSSEAREKGEDDRKILDRRAGRR